jgi:TPR repeat protein
LYPVSVSDYAPKKVRERAASEGQPAAGAADRSSETPKTPRQHPTEARPADGTDNDHEAPLAPTGPHERPANGPDDGNDNRPIPFKPRGAREESPARADSAEGEFENDLDRLESSLNQIRRERAELEDEALARSPRASAEGDDEPFPRLARASHEGGDEPVPRLPRASQLPPVPGLRAPAGGRDNYIDGFRLPRSLGPTYVPPPPLREKRTNHLGLALRVAVACAIAAPAAYYLAAGGGPSKSDRAPKLSAAGTRPVDLPPMPAMSPAVAQQGAPAQALPPRAQVLPAQPLPPQAVPPQGAQGFSPQGLSPQATPGPVAQAPQAPAAQMQVPASQPLTRLNDVRPDPAAPAQGAGVTMASVNPAAPPPAASKPVRTVDTEAVRLLLTQGEQFVNTGDLVTARLLFRRAAESGDADGALSLGATYDPGVLAKLGVRGIAPDIEQARTWYEKARDLGSAEAPRRLKLLANR